LYRGLATSNKTARERHNKRQIALRVVAIHRVAVVVRREREREGGNPCRRVAGFGRPPCPALPAHCFWTKSNEQVPCWRKLSCYYQLLLTRVITIDASYQTANPGAKDCVSRQVLHHANAIGCHSTCHLHHGQLREGCAAVIGAQLEFPLVFPLPCFTQAPWPITPIYLFLRMLG